MSQPAQTHVRIDAPTPVTAAPSRRADAIPSDLRRVLSRSRACIGVVHRDGRIALLGPQLLSALGFDPSDDLEGLPFAALWHHGERRAVLAGMTAARRGATEQVTLDLAYLVGVAESCVVTIAPTTPGGPLLLTLERR